MPMEEFRSGMGWKLKELPPYVMQSYVSAENEKKALKLALMSDLVLMGTAPEKFIEERLKEDKLIFRYSERPLKEGFIKFFIPRLTRKYLHLHVRNRHKNIYILGAGAFTAYDYRLMFDSYPDKCYKFGYFPEHREYDTDRLIKDKEEFARSQGTESTILWLGRMIRLKHPELVIKACRQLLDKGYDFKLHMVGEGEMRPYLEKLAGELGMEDKVSFEDFLSPDEARDLMARYMIYVMTSDKLEGWGSVIYEALNAGCAQVASHVCGATPFLIKDGETGLIFKSGSTASLSEKLESLLKDRELVRRLGENAYRQMHEVWNPRVAAENMLRLADDLSEGRECSIKEGPCSRMGYLKNSWYR